MWMVTVKLPRRKDHDPLNKKAGGCPVNGKRCTDTTGQHHTVLVTSEPELRKLTQTWHVTRVEDC